MTDIASLGLQIDSSQAVTAKQNLDNLTAAGAKAETQAEALSQATLNANTAASKAAEAFYNQRDAVQGASDQVQKILSRYDPLGTKLRSLQTDFDALNKAIATGAVGGTSDTALDKTMASLNAEIAKTKGLMSDAGVGMDKASGSAGGLGLSLNYATRELVVMGHEAMNGNFSRMPGSFLSLVSHSNLLQLALSPVGLAIGAVAITVGTLIAAYISGEREMAAMNSALASTHDFAGMTRSSMADLAEQVSETGTRTIGTSKEIVTALVASGRYSAENIAALAKMTDTYADLTGESASKAAEKLSSMFEDPAKASEKLNEQYHYLTSAQLEQIRNLQEQGKQQEAVTAATKAFNDGMPEAISKLNDLGTAWDKIEKAVSSYWDKLKQIGESRTTQQQIDLDKFSIAHTDPGTDANKAWKERLALDEEILVGEQNIAAINAKEASDNAAQIKADALVRQVSQLGKIQALQNEIDNIQEHGTDSPAKAQAIFDIRKQIADLQRSAGAQARELATNSIKDEEKIAEVQDKAAIEALNSQLELGRLNKEEHAQEVLNIQVEALQRKKLDDARILAIGGLTPAAKQALEADQKLIDAQIAALKAAREDASVVAADKVDRQQNAQDAKDISAITKAQLDRNVALQDEIDKIKDHNAEIGKTKEQIDTLHATEVQRDIDRLQGEINYQQATGITSDEQDAYVANLQKQIDLLRQKQQALQDGSRLQQQADDVKKFEEDSKRAAASIETAMTDGLMRSFEKGGSFAETFKSSVEATFKTLVLRPIVQTVVQSGVNAVTGSTLGSVASGSSALGGLGSLSSFGSLFSGGSSGSGIFGGISGAADSVFQNIGANIGSQSIADIGNYGFGVPALSGILQIASGNVGGGVGSTIGGVLGSSFGPIGTIVGSALGSFIGSALFGGGGNNNAQASGPPDDYKSQIGFGANGMVGAGYNAYGHRNDGGIYGQDFVLLGAAAQQTIMGTVASLIYTANAAGLATNSLNLMAISARGDAGNLQDSMTQALNSVSDQIAQQLLPNLANFTQGTETLSQTFIRVTSDAAVLNSAFAVMGRNAMQVFGGDPTVAIANEQSLIAKAGGGSNLGSALNTFYTAFYTDAEKLQVQQNNIQTTFRALGIAMPQTDEAFKALVNSIDLTTSSGQDMYLTLLGIAPAFDAVQKAAASTTTAVTDTATSINNLLNSVNSILFKTSLDKNRYIQQAKAGITPSGIGIIPHFAGGGDFAGGGRWVGENGPEYEVTAPSHIYNSADSKRMFDMTEVVNAIADLRSDMRAGQVAIAKSVAYSAGIMRRWEGTGMPLRDNAANPLNVVT